MFLPGFDTPQFNGRDFFICDYHQSSAAAIYPQQHCVGWALPNTEQAI